MELHYKSYGQGEPLIILHGLFGSLENWHSVLRLFPTRATGCMLKILRPLSRRC